MSEGDHLLAGLGAGLEWRLAAISAYCRLFQTQVIGVAWAPAGRRSRQ